MAKVDSGTQDTSRAFGVSYLTRSKKIILLAVLVIMALGLISWALYIHSSSNIVGKECTIDGNRHLLQEASTLITNPNGLLLKPIVTKIQHIANYQKDPNCLYPLLVYSLHTSNLSAASKYLKEFNKVYNSHIGLSPYLGKDLYSISSLKEAVVTLQNQSKVIKGLTFSSHP